MLRPIQSTFAGQGFPDLIVGLDSPDDAAIWRLDDSRLMAITTDFFTPVVDDPYDYGAIAAANALSDLYAMGATPALALTVACLPVDLDPDIVEGILRGLAEKVREAGAVIAGGHTIQDQEPKVGLVAVGFAQQGELLTKAAAQPGDLLYLTKPLGTGVISTALKSDKADAADVAAAVAWMKKLNQPAAALARQHQLRAATDITGFSLLGHGLELAQASGVRLNLNLGAVPLLPGAAGYAEAGFIPGGTRDNQKHFSPHVVFPQHATDSWRQLLFDAQTSGGLLLAVPPAHRTDLMRAAQSDQVPLWEVGSVEAGEGVIVSASGGPSGAAIEGRAVTYIDV